VAEFDINMQDLFITF